MRRPFLVTLIGVLGVLGGVFSVIAGVVIAVKYDDRQFLADAEVSYADRNQLLAAGLAMIAVGVITVLVSVALLGGSRLARALFTFVELVHIAGAVWVLVEYSHTVSRAQGITQIVVGVVVLYFLWGTRKAKQFFA